MQSCDHSATRRAFIGYFSSVGLGSTLLTGVLWAKLQEEPTPRITAAMLNGALTIAGLDFSDEDQQQMLTALNQKPDRFTELRKIHINPDLAPLPPYSPIVPGPRPDR